MAMIAVYAKVRVNDGKRTEFLSAFEALLAHVRDEPGTLAYALHESYDDPNMFWTAELYADDASFEAHRASVAHQAATPAFAALIAESDVAIGTPLLGKGLPG